MTAIANFALWFAMLLPAPGHIFTEYYPAFVEARKSGKMLLVDFGTGFDFKTVDAKSLERYVICRVPVDYTLKIDGKPARLIEAPALRKPPSRVSLKSSTARRVPRREAPGSASRWSKALLRLRAAA